jgi:hypothetical protein
MAREDGGDEEEDIVTGTEGEGTEGSDSAGRDDDSEVSAEHADQEEDDGEQDEAVAAGEQQQARQPSRGANRFQRLSNERNELRDKLAQRDREMEELRRAQTARQTQESEEQRQTRRALMTPEERVTDDLAQIRREFAETQRQQHFQTQAYLDKTNYDAKAATNPVYAKYRDVIEEQFQRQLSLGRPVEREILLQNHLGKLALESAGRSGGQRRQAKARVEQQRVSPGSGRGDTQSQRGKAGDTAESRLKDVFI